MRSQHPPERDSESTGPRARVLDERRDYVPPQLRALGDVRSLTLGGSLGTGDSGSPGTQQF